VVGVSGGGPGEASRSLFSQFTPFAVSEAESRQFLAHKMASQLLAKPLPTYPRNKVKRFCQNIPSKESSLMYNPFEWQSIQRAMKSISYENRAVRNFQSVHPRRNNDVIDET